MGRLQPNLLQEIANRLACLRIRGEAVDQHTVGNLVANGSARIEASEWVLEDQLHAPAKSSALIASEGGKVLAVEPHGACSRCQ
ncbi:hypothetical protein BAL199_29115 [alpha proteobacterium BAL199]|nr:hypothetical protein BAL199_29115 [alpha proteobacterium BAL199]